MRCSSCNQDNIESNLFCIYCGVPLAAAAGPKERDTGEDAAEVPTEELSLAELQKEVGRLNEEIREVYRTLSDYGIRPSIERPLRDPVERQPPPVERTPVPDMASPAPTPSPPPSTPSRPQATPSRPAPTPSRPVPSDVPRERIKVDWELILGGNWLARIGVLAVVIGVAFFLKLAFDNQWIGEAGRVALGVTGGIGLLIAGELLHRRYPIYAQALLGGGIAVLYVSIFAAFSFYGLLDIYPAAGLLFLFSVTAAALALRHDSTALAVIGILGAFAGPFILGAYPPKPTVLQTFASDASAQIMVYVVIVDLGVLALSTVRNWRWFTLLALLGSLASFGIWYGEYGEETAVTIVQGSLTAIFLIFIGVTTLFHVIWRRAAQEFDHALMVINAAAYLGISYGVLWDEFRPWMGVFTLLMAFFYGALAYAVIWRGREQANLSIMALGIAAVLLTIAVPVQLEGPWVSVAWAVEGAALVWLSFTLKMWQLRAFGTVVFAVFAIQLLAFDTPGALKAGLTPFYNTYLLSYALGVGATFLTAYLLWRNRALLMESESALFPIFLTAGNLFFTLAVFVQVDGIWIAVAWAVEALVLIWLSFRLGLYELRLFGTGLFVGVAVRLLVFNTQIDPEEFRLILNYRMMAFASGIAALYLAALLVARERRSVMSLEKSALVPGLLIGANFLTLWVLSFECIAVVDSGIVGVTGSTAYYVKSLALSLTWAIYASVCLAIGIVGRWRMVRMAGLGLLAVPIVKLFLFDSLALEQGYRVAAFLSLGVIMLTVGFLYQRYSEVIKGFLFEEQRTSGQT